MKLTIQAGSPGVVKVVSAPPETPALPSKASASTLSSASGTYVGSWNGTPGNLAPEEHDAIAWFTAQELTTLEMAHPSYRDLFQAVLSAAPN